MHPACLQHKGVALGYSLQNRTPCASVASALLLGLLICLQGSRVPVHGFAAPMRILSIAVFLSALSWLHEICGLGRHDCRKTGSKDHLIEDL